MLKKPNVLVLMTDQQRFDTIQRGHMCQTPHIEALMERGVHFTKAYTPNAICSPARASLMTGLFPSQHGMVDCTHNVKPYRAELDKTAVMWPQQLEQAGYSGGYFGKWHVERSNQLEDFGFATYIHEHSEQFEAYRKQLGFGTKKFSQKYELQHHGYQDRLLYGVLDEPAEASEPYFLYSQAIDFIEQKKDANEPWMTVVSTLEPHDPYVALQSYLDAYDIDQIELPASFQDDLTGKPVIYERLRSVWSDLSERDAKMITACYYASCTLIDDQVGRIVKALERSGQLDNTIIIFTSDHGELLGAHGLYMKGVPACEEVYHIPLVISGYGVEEPGRDCAAFVNLIDLAPTLLDMTGSKPVDRMAGRSLKPLLSHADGNEKDWGETYAEFHGQRLAYTQRIVWHDRFKYVYNGFDHDELYDLEDDPHEMNNIAKDSAYAAILEDMSKRMWRNVYRLNDYSLGNTDYGMFRFAPIGPNNKDNPYTLQGPASR